ncbi:MCE family protein [Qaidamihabitans albus]|uniref:MCE family protein n=1 Tax=Qaidamihabitans albus TaxID=2795733 RepID=UPI0018F1DC94|nr:MCE family protein [Qaidamihabitans albus]
MYRRRLPSSAIKMAVFTAVTVVLIGLLGTLIGNVGFDARKTYAAVFDDATGVHEGDRVRLSGVDVGAVSGLRLTHDGERQRAVVEFNVNEKVPVYRNAQLHLRYENLVGQRYLAIVEEPGSGEPMPEGGTFPATQTVPALNLTVLFNGFQPLFRALDPKQVNELSHQIVQTLQGQGGTLRNLLANTAELTRNLANKDVVIGRVVGNLNAVLGEVDQRQGKLTELIDGFRTLMRGLAEDRDTIDGSLTGLASLLGSTTGLLADVRDPLRADIASMNEFAGQLADTRHVLDDKLKNLPRKLNTINRAGSYGSWFNFYVCGLQLNVHLAGRDLPLSTPNVMTNERDTVCAGGSR